MLIFNPHARFAAYDPALQALMNLEQAREARHWLSSWSGLHPGASPLRELPGWARLWSLGRVSLKDESVRSPLGSFKALGAPLALLRWVRRRHPGWAVDDLVTGRHAASLADATVISATDGNHGRALAAAAQSTGCRCVIVLHRHVSAEREAAIAAFGAQIMRVSGDYDDSVREAAALAARHGWQVISDTSYEGYEEIPRDVMQGYAVIADEMLEQAATGTPDCPYTHVFLQGGVGGLAAGIVSHLVERYGPHRPRFVVVEPRQADCLLQSALAGRPARASGAVDSLMAGLACGETSPLAWRFLASSVDAFMTIEDGDAVVAMRLLAQGSTQDVPVVSGESGAAGFAGLCRVALDPTLRAQLALDAQARVLCISTEGATDPAVYAALAGQSAQAVLEAQARWQPEPLARSGSAQASG